QCGFCLYRTNGHCYVGAFSLRTKGVGNVTFSTFNCVVNLHHGRAVLGGFKRQQSVPLVRVIGAVRIKPSQRERLVNPVEDNKAEMIVLQYSAKFFFCHRPWKWKLFRAHVAELSLYLFCREA